MRRWLWGALALAVLVGVVALMSPNKDEQRAAPEPDNGVQNTENNDLIDEGNLDMLNKVEIIQIDREDDVWEVQAEYNNGSQPQSSAEWDNLARAIAFEVSRLPGTQKNIEVNIYANDELKVTKLVNIPQE